MKLFKKRTIALALACAAALFASCRTEFEGEVEGEYADDGIKTEVGIDSSAAACSGWKKFYAYAFATGETDPLGAWPGTEMTALTGEYAGFYATNVTGIGSSEYSLIFHNGDGDQFDAGKFTKGGSWLWNADGDWSDNWRFETTVIADDPEPTDDEEDDGEVVTPGYIRGGTGIGGDGQALTFTDSGEDKIATYTWTAAASGWGAGDGKIAFKLTEYNDWNTHDGSTSSGGVTYSGSSNKMQLAVGSDFTALKKITTDADATSADNVIITGVTVGSEYKMTVKISGNKVYVKVEATENTGN